MRLVKMRLKNWFVTSLLLFPLLFSVSQSKSLKDNHDIVDDSVYFDVDNVAESSVAKARIGLSGRGGGSGLAEGKKRSPSSASAKGVSHSSDVQLSGEMPAAGGKQTEIETLDFAGIPLEFKDEDSPIGLERAKKESEPEVEPEDEEVEEVDESQTPLTLPDDIKGGEEPLKNQDSKKSNQNIGSTGDASASAAAVSSSKVGLPDFATDQLSTVWREPAIALFTIANTNISTPYYSLPYREKYQWWQTSGPCKSFDLKVPDELAEKSMLTLCIFRPNLKFEDETNKFIFNPQDSSLQQNEPPKKHDVMGFVINVPNSLVVGTIDDNDMFYGHITLPENETVFIVEPINLLEKLMRNNKKTLKNMLVVMHAQDKKQDKQETYNAVVTKGSSLANFLMFSSSVNNQNTFLMFSTSHNSYIAAGDPTMHIDDRGEVILESGSNQIHVVEDGSIKITIPDKLYTFRPNGRTIVKEGMEIRTIQEHEGSVAITAYTSSATYDCVLPTPAFEPERQGGYVCRVCLAMDQPFKDHYLRAVEEKMEGGATAAFELHYLGTNIIDRVSWIFRSMDLNGDNRPDDIGLEYDHPPLNWSYPDVGEEDLNDQDVELLFQSLESYNFGDCCLGIGFTMKNLPNNAIGQRIQVATGPDGVCTGKTGRIPSNLIIMSANSKEGNYSTITEDQLVYATANQIGAAFGAKPDETGNDVCDQFVDRQGATRHYLMWGDVLRNTTLDEENFSTCSKKNIMKTMSTCISSCFDIDLHPFCGNGIVEEGEECDCGSERSCKRQTCCYARDGKHPCRKTGVGCTSGAASFSSTSAGTLLYIAAISSSLVLAFTRHLLFVN